MEILLLLGVIIGIVGILRLLSRPHTVFAVEGGELRVVRGKPPQAMANELGAWAAASPTVSARIELKGSGRRLEVTTTGAEDSLAQQIRNIVHTHRRR